MTSDIQPAAGPFEANIPGSLFTMSQNAFERLMLLAEMYAASSFNSAKKPMGKGDFFIIMLKGVELGLSPTTAVDFISVINGKPCLDGKGMLALMYSNPHIESIAIDSQETYCTVTIKRKGMPTAHTETFSMEDARKMKVYDNGGMILLADKATWKSMPRTMLKWRAVAACARAAAADIIGGLYTLEEMGDSVMVSDDGSMTPVPQLSAPQRPALPPPAADDAQPQEPPKPWYQTGALQTLVERARNAGYIEPQQDANDLLALLGNGATWSKYAGAGEAGTAIKAAVEALKGSALNNNAAPQNGPAPTPSAHAEPAQAGQQKGKVSSLRYNGGDKPKITAKVGDTYATWWKGRTELAAMCGEAWALASELATWEQSDKWIDVPPITVTIAPAKNPNFWDIVAVEPVGYSGPIASSNPNSLEAAFPADRFQSADANELPF